MKITIEINHSIEFAKQAYRDHYGHRGKITKKMLAEFFEELLQGDLESITITDLL